MSNKHIIGAALLLGLLATLTVLICKQSRGASKEQQTVSGVELPADGVPEPEPPFAAVAVTQNVTVGAYFQYMDDLVRQYDSIVPYPLSEHLLVRANPHLIDTLANTDYYRQMAFGHFVLDQRQMTVLHPGDTLYLPGPQTAAALLADMKNTYLDINIPAFRLRIVEGDSTLFSFPVRVGKKKKKFLTMAGNLVDLRTHTGMGEIVRLNRDPVFYDPVTGDQFEFTRRDDGNTTLMPLIPWIEPALDGVRYGQMIHPTTNPRTLGKAASNGCIGLREADAWYVYYYAPLGTKVVIRYDLMEINEQGDTLRFEDVYRYGKSKPADYASVFSWPKAANTCWCEP